MDVLSTSADLKSFEEEICFISNCNSIEHLVFCKVHSVPFNFLQSKFSFLHRTFKFLQRTFKFLHRTFRFLIMYEGIGIVFNQEHQALCVL